MIYDPKIHHRRSIRIKGYNYSLPNMYYVTICTNQKQCILGEIQQGGIILNKNGNIVKEYIENIKERFDGVEILTYTIMPNHIHLIIKINVGAIHESPHNTDRNKIRTDYELPIQDKKQRRKMLLPKIIGYLKMNTAKKINELRNTEGISVWQKNYFEHIIRNEKSLFEIMEYIKNNPLKWLEDEYNPEKNESNL